MINRQYRYNKSREADTIARWHVIGVEFYPGYCKQVWQDGSKLIISEKAGKCLVSKFGIPVFGVEYVGEDK